MHESVRSQFLSTCHTIGRILRKTRNYLAVPVRNMLSLAAKRRNHIACIADSAIMLCTIMHGRPCILQHMKRQLIR